MEFENVTNAQRAQARVGTSLNGAWRLDALIGLGGMAAVYAATHRKGQRVAIKLLHPERARTGAIARGFSGRRPSRRRSITRGSPR